MGAPKGNQFWKLRESNGRNRKFETAEDLWSAAEEYFEWCIDNPLKEQKAFSYEGKPFTADVDKMRAFTLRGLSVFLEVSDTYLIDLEKSLSKKSDKDFSSVVGRIRDVIYTQKFEGAAAGILNANIIARELGLKDSQSVEHDISDKLSDRMKLAEERARDLKR